MKKFVTVLISILVFSGIVGVNNVLSQTNQINDVLIQYFDALRTGNLQMLRSLLSDELLKRRINTLSNPRYSEFLKSIYGHSIFNITNINQNIKNKIDVDIEVVTGSQTQLIETITFIKEHGDWKLDKDKKATGAQVN